MNFKKLLVSSALIVLVLAMPAYASPAYRSNIHQLFEEVDLFFKEISPLYCYPSGYFMPKDYEEVKTFSSNPYLDTIYNPGDLIITWDVITNNFSAPAIFFDEKGFKGLRLGRS